MPQKKKKAQGEMAPSWEGRPQTTYRQPTIKLDHCPIPQLLLLTRQRLDIVIFFPFTLRHKLIQCLLTPSPTPCSFGR
ncbi:hypothetical protein I7I53_06593 [Histoplasma capsulatum var. duboisii H88]|uniref:Uncharacterized protein n=1 Tax=Ajellomyces capsulatus (strain H88) TaxID=544711 RepID=A0A8A1LF70_AJEC8|nr:hypothetical protein I7I53_06593 [Histoplasma capsulatum var. duboisii H88]